jgi:hypothetical protein
MESIDCLGSYGDQDCCFHDNCLDLLEWLQTRAWSETRYRVFSTIGTLLPAELTERVFECTLDAEDVPLDPRVKERLVIDFAEEDETAQQHLKYCQNSRMVRARGLLLDTAQE